MKRIEYATGETLLLFILTLIILNFIFMCAISIPVFFFCAILFSVLNLVWVCVYLTTETKESVFRECRLESISNKNLFLLIVSAIFWPFALLYAVYFAVVLVYLVVCGIVSPFKSVFTEVLNRIKESELVEK